VLGEINVAGYDEVSEQDRPAESGLAFMVGFFGVFIIIHYGVVEVIYDFFVVFFQIPGIKRVERFFVKKDADKIFRLHKQFSARQQAGGQFCNIAIYTVCPQGIDVHRYSLPEAGAVGII
jgi:hypothetical protein